MKKKKVETEAKPESVDTQKVETARLNKCLADGTPTVCGTCHQKVLLKKRLLNARTLRYLTVLVWAHKQNLKKGGDGWVAFNVVDAPGKPLPRGGEYSRFFKLWRFAEHKSSDDETVKGGLWKPNERLFKFLRGKLRVAKWHLEFNKKSYHRNVKDDNVNVYDVVSDNKRKSFDLWHDVLSMPTGVWNTKKIKAALPPQTKKSK